ncbi:hypothetical protein NQ314_005799 [Rhamnusium bicolor]|uniref:Uncharacterized protein n=1 Tax=Rhamnusium bicolor TaxID=1586634 RepID=A0AAV8ZF81_9CUCU|nr:hypothetical protein NQ314_005799 [Rhamnusium bicolor]
MDNTDIGIINIWKTGRMTTFEGCYSSADPHIIDTHLKQISKAGIGVVVVSWTPPNFTDSPNQILTPLFNTALNKYGDHPALYKVRKPLGHKTLPVIYIYDSYLIPAVAWRELLSSKGNLSVRGTAIDAIYLGLLVESHHKYHIKKSQFDGFYTYFATNSFTYGSTWKNWQYLSKFATQNKLIFVPSVGPGYIDIGVRPWNSANTRHRHHGQYYDVAWHTAVNARVNYVSITSFNEWHEGTQIEPARPKSSHGFTYLDYEPEGPYYYMNLTKSWITQFEKFMA